MSDRNNLNGLTCVQIVTIGQFLVRQRRLRIQIFRPVHTNVSHNSVENVWWLERSTTKRKCQLAIWASTRDAYARVCHLSFKNFASRHFAVLCSIRWKCCVRVNRSRFFVLVTFRVRNIQGAVDRKGKCSIIGQVTSQRENQRTALCHGPSEPMLGLF